jgi:thiol:disulfide interchange protein
VKLRILCCAVLLAQVGAAQEITLRKQFVTMAPAELTTIARGHSVPVELQFRITPGYHINSNRPKQEYLRKTVLNLDAPTDIAIERVIYPEGEDMSFPFSPDEKLNVYSGDFALKVLVKPLPTVVPAKYAVHGRLNYQACDKAACYPPKQMAVTFEIKVVKGVVKRRRATPQSPHIH